MKELESIITNLQKHQTQMGSLINSIKHIRKTLYQFSILFQKIELEGILPSSFYDPSITPIPKLDKDIQEKKTTDQYIS